MGILVHCTNLTEVFSTETVDNKELPAPLIIVRKHLYGQLLHGRRVSKVLLPNSTILIWRPKDTIFAWLWLKIWTEIRPEIHKRRNLPKFLNPQDVFWTPSGTSKFFWTRSRSSFWVSLLIIELQPHNEGANDQILRSLNSVAGSDDLVVSGPSPEGFRTQPQVETL
jgi:hypothetical protein